MKLLKALRLPFLLLVLNNPAFGSVDKCKISNLSDLTVFTTGNITALKSDFQGSTASGGNVYLENFYIDQTSCLSIAAKGNINIFKGATKGAIEGQSSVTIESARVNGFLRSNGNITLYKASADGAIGPEKIRVIESARLTKEKRKLVPSLNFEKLTQQMKNFSDQFAKLHDTFEADVKDDTVILYAKKTKNAVTIAADGLALSGINRIKIRGEENHQLVINIKGIDIRLVALDVELTGSIGPKDIIWNFRDAQNIYITNTVNGYYGIPGTIIAPNASVEFYEGLITGALYAKSINYTDLNRELKSGQINDGRVSELPLE